MNDSSGTSGNRGEVACALLIAALESELATVSELRKRYASGELDTATLVALRHFCAGLVESAVELARTIDDLNSAAEIGWTGLSAKNQGS